MNKTVSRLLAVPGLLIFSPLLTTPVSADEVVALEEIIVTANRREENLQEVAMSVSAFTDEFFQDSGTTSLQQLDQYTPNFKISPVTDTRSTSIRIRGIGSVGSNAGIDPSVGVFIDGVYQGRAGMSVADLMDIQRVEVLRGPQGTLYGKNTAAGALNIISKAPAEQFEAEVEAVVGNYEARELRGMVNFPLGDSGHATRLSGYYVENDGFDTNTYSGEKVNTTERYGARWRTLFAMGNAGDLTVSLDYSKNEGDCCAPDIIDYEGDGSPQGVPFSKLADATGVPVPEADGYDRNLYYDQPFVNDVEIGGIAVDWSAELSNEIVLTWINAWRGYESFSILDGDFSHYPGVRYETDVEVEQVSSEFRITSPVGETFDWQVGLYYYDFEMDTEGLNGFLPLVGQNFLDPPFPGGFWPDGGINFDTNTHETTSFAVFGQANWAFSEKWKLTFGARYTYEEKARQGTQVSTPDPIFPIDAPPIAGENVSVDEDRSAQDVSPMISVSYFPRDDLMFYASASQGFKSGGFNQLRTAAGVSGEFDDERSRNYEMGWKGTWLDRRLQVNGTLFFVDYEDFQSQTFDGQAITVRNAGGMESKGVEFDLVYVPNALATLGMAIGYNDATYSEFDTAECTAAMNFAETGGSALVPITCVQDLAGKPIDNAPEWTVSTFVQLQDDFGNGDLGWTARLEYNYIDDLYMAQDLDEALHRDALNMVNARVTLSGKDNQWQVTLWGRNLLDEEYHAIGFDIPVMGGFAGINAPPLTYGLTVNYRTQ